MSIYKHLAKKLLELDFNNDNKYIELKKFGQKNWFGLVYRGYNGIMSKPRKGNAFVDRSKEGFFDVYICTGIRYLERNNYKAVTHFNVFEDLLENSSLHNCYRIWRGENPTIITKNLEEQQALSALTLLMFEQELNWGNESWQRKTNFPPLVGDKYQRPRDMIMGFLKIVFHYKKVDAIPYWIYKNINGKSIKATPTFGQGYKNLENKYKCFFEELQTDSTAIPLMVGELLQMFKEKVKHVPNNIFYDENFKGKFIESVEIKNVIEIKNESVLSNKD